jgi:hypothetical protein
MIQSTLQSNSPDPRLMQPQSEIAPAAMGSQ